MRVAITVALILVVGGPSEGSDACMTQLEARKYFGTSYLYWHGPRHCWDATPGRRVLGRNGQQTKADPTDKEEQEPKWRQARSQVLPSPAEDLAQSQASESYAAPPKTPMSMQWADRWVDVTQQARALDAQPAYSVPSLPPTRTAARRSVPVLAAGGLILMLLCVMLIVAATEFVRRRVSL
jgi:hypothetical protein